MSKNRDTSKVWRQAMSIEARNAALKVIHRYFPNARYKKNGDCFFVGFANTAKTATIAPTGMSWNSYLEVQLDAHTDKTYVMRSISLAVVCLRLKLEASPKNEQSFGRLCVEF